MGSNNSVKTAIICFFLIVALSGCGGGGGGIAETPANIAPVANAGPDLTETLFFPDTAIITLTGTASDSDGTIVGHQWVQTGGADVTLIDADTSSATFSVDAETQAYSFSYTVTDDDGAQTTDTVAVYVTEAIFSDSFANASNWTFENDAVDLENWTAINGALLQTTPIVNGAFWGATSYHVGTYAFLNPAITAIPPNYRFSVDITPPNNNTSNAQSNDVGIMFRYQSPTNYYRVSMNTKYGFTRFEKRKNGAFSTLAVNARGYVEGQVTTLTAEVNGDTIIVWIDGDPVFAEVDPDFSSGTVGLYCQGNTRFENVLITENPLQPLVVVSSPLAYSVTPGNLVDDLTATAVALNIPAGGSVAFSLDGGSEITVAGSGNIYSHLFPGVANGNYDVAAIVRNADGSEANSDINSMVGRGGDYYITVGDSITNGYGDSNKFNNDSDDGRIVAIQGYQARLSDNLTTATGVPQIVFNEGIPGDRSSDLNSRIDSILDRHPGANKALLLIGTNDALSSVSDSDYETRVTQAATKIVVDGKEVWLAKILPIYTSINPPPGTPDAGRNAFIQQYNVKIDSIASGQDEIFSGPNFYTDFNSSAFYQDTLHPNDNGYNQVMASRWSANLP